MTDTKDYQPTIIGKISEGVLGDLDLYFIDLPSCLGIIYDDRVSKKLCTGDDVDEFYFLAPADQYGTKSPNSTTGGTSSFVASKSGEEPIVLWKAFYHHVATFIKVATPDEMDITGVFNPKSHVEFVLPKIPAMMVNQLDQFFRTVEEQNQTESIVLLTYDLEYRNASNAHDGWGFGVPTQKNTGVHCDYNKANVIAELGPTTRVVGTVHSHPGMSAHASATDHNDQAGFDGIHITFGWSSKKDSETEYYVELVQGNNFYKANPNDVMDLDSTFIYRVNIGGVEYDVDRDNLEIIRAEWEIPTEEMTGWTSKVSKSIVTLPSGGYGSVYGQHGGGNPKAWGPSRTQLDTSDFLPALAPKPDQIGEFWGTNMPDPTKNNFLVTVKRTDKSCPICETKFGKRFQYIVSRRQCLSCGVFLLFDDESIDQIDAARIFQGFVPMKDFLDLKLPFVIFDSVELGWKSIDVIEAEGVLKEGGDIPKVQS